MRVLLFLTLLGSWHVQGSEEWHSCTAPGGALHVLLHEQDGELCGPKPVREEVPEAEAIPDGFAGLPGNIMSGPLLSLLKEMGGLAS